MLSSPLQKGMKALMWPKSPSGTGSICLYTRAASLTENGDCFHAKEPTRRFCRAAARAGGAGVSPAVSLVRFCTSRNEHPLASLAGKQSFFPSLRDTPIRPACGRPPSPRRRLKLFFCHPVLSMTMGTGCPAPSSPSRWPQCGQNGPSAV